MWSCTGVGVVELPQLVEMTSCDTEERATVAACDSEELKEHALTPRRRLDTDLVA